MNRPTTIIMEIRSSEGEYPVWLALQSMVESGAICEYHTLTIDGTPQPQLMHRPDLADLCEVIAENQ